MDAREERRDRSRSNSSASSGRPGAYDSPPRSHVNSEDEAENYRDDGEYDSDGDTEVEDNGEPDGNIVNRWAVFNAMPVRRQEDSNPRINRSASQERLNDKLMIRHLREEIRKTKRRLDSAYLDLEESEYYYRREKEAKLDLERRVRSLEKEKQEYELDFSSMNCELTMAEADNKFLTHENEMLSDLAQQYFHSKEQQIKYKDRAKRQLRKRKKECKDLETEISQIANADEYRRTIEYERNRADGYQNLMQHIHLMYQNDEQLRREQDPSPLRSCEICLQKYMAVGRAVPRILVKCGHTLCHKCVESLRPQEPEGVRCPFCRTLTKISRRKGIESLPKNFTLVS
ncbi:Protein CBG25560 [Caenorhabditis briggsae]|uniref:Protein CBG25560 n=1 Tax=Caenorhabditis briggsae TaxID=6238 RepID=B6IF47_CAEBR|nr:Protein CBG25560 [Caenorhabditis briggsae]CAR98527.1 Protein CBG25560 [Caenorhabditis briggsae]